MPDTLYTGPCVGGPINGRLVTADRTQFSVAETTNLTLAEGVRSHSDASIGYTEHVYVWDKSWSCFDYRGIR